MEAVNTSVDTSTVCITLHSTVAMVHLYCEHNFSRPDVETASVYSGSHWQKLNLLECAPPRHVAVSKKRHRPFCARVFGDY